MKWALWREKWIDAVPVLSFDNHPASRHRGATRVAQRGGRQTGCWSRAGGVKHVGDGLPRGLPLHRGPFAAGAGPGPRDRRSICGGRDVDLGEGSPAEKGRAVVPIGGQAGPSPLGGGPRRRDMPVTGVRATSERTGRQGGGGGKRTGTRADCPGARGLLPGVTPHILRPQPSDLDG